MSSKYSTVPATISLSREAREVLKRLAAIVSPIIGKPATYGEAIIEADRIVREHLAAQAKQEVSA